MYIIPKISMRTYDLMAQRERALKETGKLVMAEGDDDPAIVAAAFIQQAALSGVKSPPERNRLTALAGEGFCAPDHGIQYADYFDGDPKLVKAVLAELKKAIIRYQLPALPKIINNMQGYLDEIKEEESTCTRLACPKCGVENNANHMNGLGEIVCSKCEQSFDADPETPKENRRSIQCPACSAFNHYKNTSCCICGKPLPRRG